MDDDMAQVDPWEHREESFRIYGAAMKRGRRFRVQPDSMDPAFVVVFDLYGDRLPSFLRDGFRVIAGEKEGDALYENATARYAPESEEAWRILEEEALKRGFDVYSGFTVFELYRPEDTR